MPMHQELVSILKLKKKQKNKNKVMGAETLCTYVSTWYASSVASVYYYEYD